MRIESQPAFILHSRHYRNSSLLVEFLTPDFGRVSGVVRGVRANSKSARQRRSLMQPFIPLLIGWSGNSDLKTIGRFEHRDSPLPLTGTRLFSAIYVNELLTRLVQHYDHNPELYALYEWVLQGLVLEQLVDVVLRRFELKLLQDLGYGINLLNTADSHEPIVADQYYRYNADRGFTPLGPRQQPVDRRNLFAGADLVAIADGDFSPSVRQAAKRLCRQAIQLQLGDKPLKSRELFA